MKFGNSSCVQEEYQNIVPEKEYEAIIHSNVSLSSFSLILVITFFWCEHWIDFTADFRQFRNFSQR